MRIPLPHTHTHTHITHSLTHTHTHTHTLSLSLSTSLSLDLSLPLPPSQCPPSCPTPQIYSTSCDDDDQAFYAGQWIGVEDAIGSDSFVVIDCTSGDGGGSNTNGETGTNGNDYGCCDEKFVDVFATFPLPTRMCASSNTGGGVAVTFSRRVLTIHE